MSLLIKKRHTHARIKIKWQEKIPASLMHNKIHLLINEH